VVADTEKTPRLWAPERRQQLVQVTAEIIAREGVDRVRIPEVAAAAGVTRPVVYKFFPNRQALVVAVLEDFTDALRAGLRERLVATPPAGPDRNADDFRHTVRTFVEVVFDLIDEKTAGGWYLFGTVAPFPEIEDTIADVRRRMIEPWYRTIADVTGAPHETSQVLAQMLVAISRATVQQWIDGLATREASLDALMRGTSALIAEFTVSPSSAP
jgi:AcrR family transcriptional regulator